MSAVNVVARWFSIALVVGVSACGGGGGGDSPAPVQSKVFAADEVNGAVGSTENANPSPGQQIAITRIITGPNTQIPPGPPCFGCMQSLALDSGRDQLYVATRNGVLVFNNAGTATGNIAPQRIIIAGGTGLNRHIQLNTASDILYIATPEGSISRIDGASSANSSSPVTRAYTLTPFNPVNPGVDVVTDVALDATNDVLYVGISHNGFGSVAIFPGISGIASGSLPLNQEMGVNAVNPSITIDGPRNRLYVANHLGQVMVYDNARTKTTGALPDRTITLPFFTDHHLFLETTNDRLYAAGQNRVVILNNAGSAIGSVTAAAAVLQTNSGLTAVVARP